MFTNNSHDWVENVYIDDHLLYNGYNGDDEYLIKTNEGTTKYVGTLCIPTYDVDIADFHQMNYVLTGDKVADAKEYNFMEVPPPFNATNVQPGQIYIPMNTDFIMMYYSYLYKNETHEKNRAGIPVVLFKIVNGEYIFQGTNPYVKVIMERDTIPPIIQIDSPVDGKTYDSNYVRFNGSIIEDNLRYAYYSLNGCITKIPMKDKLDEEKLLTNGSYTAIFYAKDEFRQDTEKTINFIVNKPTVIDDTTLEETLLYPNPVHDQLNIKYKSGMSGNAYRETFSIDGRLMDKKQIGSKIEEIISVEEYKRGVYILRVTDGTKRQNLKFTKELVSILQR